MIVRILPSLVSSLLCYFIFCPIVLSQNDLKIGWAQVDITPDKPVLIAGQFHARVSEGVLDPITATILVWESGADVESSEKEGYTGKL